MTHMKKARAATKAAQSLTAQSWHPEDAEHCKSMAVWFERIIAIQNLLLQRRARRAQTERALMHLQGGAE